VSRRHQTSGKVGQAAAKQELLRLGVRRLQEVATPVIIKNVNGRRIVVAYKEKVVGDFIGIMPNGIAVLCETKRREEDRLAWSDLEKHQVEALSEWHECGGLAILAWVHPAAGVLLLPWGGLPGFRSGTSILLSSAERLALRPEHFPFPSITTTA
jgi:hypothetical protein